MTEPSGPIIQCQDVHKWFGKFEAVRMETGSPTDIFNNPQEDRTKLFLSQILSH